MLKKTLSLLLAVMMVVSVMAVGVVASNAATTDGFTPEATKFYFDVEGAVNADGTVWSELMGKSDKIAFYMAGGDFDTETNATKPLAWGKKALQGTATKGETGIFEIDPVAKGYTLTPGVQYKIIFVRCAGANWKDQTCSLFFTTDCLGHVAKCDGTQMENDVDSTKKSLTVYWDDTIDPADNGPVLCITSIGNVVGSCVEQGKTKYSLFVDFLSKTVEDFQNKTCYENAHKFKCEISPESDGYKTEQKLIDDIGAGLGLTKDEVQQAFDEDVVKEYFETAGISCAWSYDDSTLPGGAAHEHTPGEAVRENEVPATCKAEGSYDEVIYCSECGAEISRETKTIDKLDHTPGEAVRENEVPASCDKEGSYDEVVYCTECGAEISRETKTIEKTEHNIVFVEEKPATATVDGMKAHYECTVCHKLFSDETGTVEVSAEDLVIKAETVRGDADSNGTFESTDVTAVQRVLVDYVVENYNAVAADADLDGEVDIIDVSLMQRVLANMTTFEKWDAKHAKG